MNYAGQIERTGDKARQGRINEAPRLYRFGGFSYRQKTKELFKGRSKIPLKVQSARVLGILLESSGNLVSREDIIKHIWPDRTVEYDLSLNSCLRDIRHALGDNPKEPRYVETLAKRGYRFIAEVQLYPDTIKGAVKSKILKPGMAAALVGVGFATAAAMVGPSLYKSYQARQAIPAAVSEEARTLMLAGVSALYDHEVPKTVEALAYFDQAVEADPGFIDAYMMTVRTLYARGNTEDAPKAFTAIDKILEIDPLNAEAMAMGASIKQTLLFDYQGAEKTYRDALRADPGFNPAYIGLAGLYMLQGETDGSLAQVEQALNIDTIRVTSSGQVGWFYYLAGRHEEGLGYCFETLEVNPESAGTYSCFVNHYLAMGEQQKAAENALKYLSAAGFPQAELNSLAQASPERILDAMYGFEAAKETSGRFNPGRVNQALALTRQGKPEKALEALNLAYEERNYYLPFIAVIPDFKPLKETREFQRLVEAINLS